jgi:hypothetical protein
MRLRRTRRGKNRHGQPASVPVPGSQDAHPASENAHLADENVGPDGGLVGGTVPPLPRRDPRAARPFPGRTDWKPVDPVVLRRILDGLNQRLPLAGGRAIILPCGIMARFSGRRQRGYFVVPIKRRGVHSLGIRNARRDGKLRPGQCRPSRRRRISLLAATGAACPQSRSMTVR